MRAHVLVIVALCAGCTFDRLNHDDRQCPCAAGWFCDESVDRCVTTPPRDAGDPDAGARDGGDREVVDAGDGGAPDAAADAGPTRPDFEGLRSVVLGGREYYVAQGLNLDVAVDEGESAALLDADVTSGVAVAAAPSSSSFPSGAYLAIFSGAGTNHEVYRTDGRSLVSTGASGLGAAPSAIFTPATSAFGDRLLLTSVRTGAPDGLFELAPGGTYVNRSAVDNSWGLAHDCVGLVDGPALLVSFEQGGSMQIAALDDSAVVRPLVTDFLSGHRKVHLAIPCRGYARGTLLVASTTDSGAPFLRQTSRVDPWMEPVEFLPLTDAVSSIAVAGGRFGDVIMIGAGDQVTAYFEDGSSYVAVDALASSPLLAFDEGDPAVADDDALWIVDVRAELILLLTVAP